MTINTELFLHPNLPVSACTGKPADCISEFKPRSSFSPSPAVAYGLLSLVSPSRSCDLELRGTAGRAKYSTDGPGKQAHLLLHFSRKEQLSNLKFQIQRQRTTSPDSAWSTGKRCRFDSLPGTYGFNGFSQDEFSCCGGGILSGFSGHFPN